VINHELVAAKLFGDTMPPAPAATTTAPTSAASIEAQRAARIFTGPEPQTDVFAAADQPQANLDDARAADRSRDRASDPAADRAADQQLVEDLGLDDKQPLAGDFAAAVRELGVDREGAQRLVDLQQVHVTAAWNAIDAGWRAEVASDPVIARDLDAARAVVRRFGDDQLRADLERFRLGNHPGLLRLLGRVGRAMEL
jgi:hypothetical protein